MRRIGLFVFVLIIVFAITSFASPPEVRFDLVLIESFDGVALTFHEPAEISIETAEATSTLSERYSASNMIDGDTTTGWIEGAPEYGIGESVRLKITGEIPRVIGIWPGYQRSESIFLRNGRPAKVRVAFVGNDPEEGDPYYDIFSYEVNLYRGYNGKMAMQPQYIYISGGDILHNMALDSLEYIELEILAVDNVDALDPDLGISEIRLYAEGKTVGVAAFGEW